MEQIENESLSESLPAASFGPAPCTRSDGWTAERQRGFLAAIAEGHSRTVEAAAAQVGMSATSAYNLRNRAAGAGFALGWQAANLLARERLADMLVSRALDGITESWTRANGETVTRHRHDNRLGMAMLTRLDRLADAQVAEGTHQAARIVAQEFEAYLDLIGGDAGPARVGLFLGLRAGDGIGEPDAELATLVGLARADRFVRVQAGHALEVDCADLDPAKRAQWTSEQWLRAEAAGVVALTPEAPEEEADDDSSQLSQFEREKFAPDPVWWDEDKEEWRSSFPPPDGFDGWEHGRFGEGYYERALSAEELAAIEANDATVIAGLRAEQSIERDAWFAALAKAPEGNAAAIRNEPVASSRTKSGSGSG